MQPRKQPKTDLMVDLAEYARAIGLLLVIAGTLAAGGIGMVLLIGRVGRFAALL